MEKGNEIKTVVPALRFPEFQGMNGWEEKKLEEIGNFIGGGTPNTAIQEYWDGGIPWYTPTEIKNGDLKSSNRTITEKGLKNSSPDFVNAYPKIHQQTMERYVDAVS